MSSPVNGHHQEKLGLRSSASQKVKKAAIQKKIESGSIVMTRLPMLKMGVTFTATTVQNPAGALKKRRAK